MSKFEKPVAKTDTEQAIEDLKSQGYNFINGVWVEPSPVAAPPQPVKSIIEIPASPKPEEAHGSGHE